VILAFGRAASAERRSEAVAWWDTTHLPDLLAVPGMLAALRMEPVSSDDQSLLLHLLLCEDRPASVMEEIQLARRSERSTGRYPSHGGVYEEIAFLPYERIVPLEYDFATADTADASA
jgi:hypothetical protein